MIEFVFFLGNRLCSPVSKYISCSLVPYDFLVLSPCSHYKIHRVPLFPQNPWETLCDRTIKTIPSQHANNDTPTSSSCLVICPLESIIEDQMVEATSLGISASSLTNLMPNELSKNPAQIVCVRRESPRVRFPSSAERPKLDSSHLYLAYSCRRIPYY